ncbi:MAG: pre-mycofactocin synthase MftD [Solirubrobacteraceae bacterium]
MASQWFESVAVAERRARRRLPRPVHEALHAGAEAGRTLSENVSAFGELGFAPHVAGAPAQRQTSTTVMGAQLSLPVLISPTGVQAVHPDGELAVARAAAAKGTAIGLSSFASKPVEAVVAANPATFFQLYWSGSRELMRQRLCRARAAGVAGLIVTLDWSFSHSRDWGSPATPQRMSVATALRMLPVALLRPRWLLDWTRAGGPPDLTVPNMAAHGERAPTFFEAYGEWMATPPPSWDEVRWLREQWDGPFMIKGIVRVDDALRAQELGASAISVSNHGGNNLDGTPASIRVLPAIADAVGEHVEVLLDGGVRRGSDVVKALALGARAVMIGRPYLWGLAAAGQAGVENVIEILGNGIDSTLRALAKPSIAELERSDVVMPDGFAVALGGEPSR